MNQPRRNVISYLQRRQRTQLGRILVNSLMLLYSLLALAPFLLLHSHSDQDHQGSNVELTHAHAWDFWIAHDEHGEESEHDIDPVSGESPGSHLEAGGEGHEGMDQPPLALASSLPSPIYFKTPTVLLLEREPPLPKSALQCLIERVPITSDSHPDGVSSILTCDLPPPAIT